MGDKESETEDTGPSCRQCQNLTGDAGLFTGGGGLRVSKLASCRIWVT